MEITYAHNHAWYKFIADDPLSQFGKNSRTKLRSTLRELSPSITITEEAVDGSFLAWFVPLFEATLSSKEHPASIDITERLNGEKEYKALTLKEDGKPLGATIFTLRKNKLVIAYRCYTHHWNNQSYAASPALFMELMIAQHAQSHHKAALTHGKDRNPYGLHAGIGLAAFKLASGCKPRLTRDYETRTLKTEDLTEDVLVFAHPKEGRRRISKAYLITQKETAPHWEQLLKYPHLLKVEVVYRD